jgi:hypothetical protein
MTDQQITSVINQCVGRPPAKILAIFQFSSFTVLASDPPNGQWDISDMDGVQWRCFTGPGVADRVIPLPV